MPELVYHLNARDEISSANEEWRSFALANDGEPVLLPHIRGRQLWDFIDDLETEHIYRLLHHRVRDSGVPVRLSFRCDAPQRRRLLELEIAPKIERGLTYRVRTLMEEERTPVAVLDPNSPRSESFVTICGWCKRIAAPPRGWLEVEEALAALSFFDNPRPPQLTHGICDECELILNEALEEGSAVAVMGQLTGK
jgi:hypothetical protein